ncbi:hypothetical protein RRG08_053929 [Elysia crispata]|uniref:Uncharacterized protein n=1 Tax=Elysia crispata TaxID=231223 RepID=A0AAE1DEQ4_9GAST|nr:hypothetical protein RRG08_053929 [Elysia crispata]
MNVIARSVDLNRAERYVTDSLLKAEQCDELFKLTEDLQTEPQGSQIFTLKKAQQMLEADPSEDTEASLRLLSRSAEVVRHYTQRYLNPDMDYYLKKITFVCWPPSEGEGCNKVVRHYTQRYLNPDMDYYLKKITFVCWPPSEGEGCNKVVRHYTQRYLNPDMDYYLKKITFVCWPPSEGEGCNKVVRHYTQRYLNPDMDYYLKKITFVCWPPSEGEGCNKVVRHYTQRYLNPDMDYYLKKITFVCWPPSEEDERKCYPQEDGSCIKFEDMSDELYRDLYTTVTFLHTADDDSDFLFLNEEKGIDGTFGLRCGRTIGFNTGDRHTLNIPKSGSKRCAMVLKYTLDRKEDDKDYRNLLAMLHRVNELRMATVEQKPEVVLKKFADAGVFTLLFDF